MAELPIAAAVVGLGYLLSGKQEQTQPMLATVPEKSIPNGDNVFNSNRVQEIRLSQQELSDQKYREALNNPDSNVIIPGPTEVYFKKVDYTDKTLPVEFQEPGHTNVKTDTSPGYATQPYYGEAHPTGEPVSDGWYGISLTGEPIDPKNFSHNNMTPFFGAKVRQNVDEYANRNIIENFTGTYEYLKPKKNEVPYLFDPQANITNMGYGMSNLSGYNRDRYIVSNIRNNEQPTERIYVGPGLNKGYTWKPCGGFQQAETRDYVLPKTVDELRVKTNPKVTYYGRVIPGKKISRPPKIGVVQKNRPDGFAIWGPERYFVTTGDRFKPKQNPEVILKHSNRTTTDLRRSVGPAGPTSNSKESIRPNIRISEKCQYTPGGPRNVDGAGKWQIPDCEKVIENYVPMKKCENKTYPQINQLTDPESTRDPYTDPRLNPCSSLHDYGRGSHFFKPNNREETACLPAGNLQPTVQSNYTPINPELRPSRRQTVIGNPRWASNIQAPHNRHPVWDPNDVPRTTVKETTLQSAREGNVGIQRPSNPRIYDPNDVPKTTVKETTLSQGRFGQPDPVNHQRPRTYDPTDVPRTTHKESTLSGYAGDAYRPTGGATETACYEVSNTNRQFTSDVEYFGNVTGDTEGAYQVVTVDPKTTNRQFTSVHEYTGNAGNSDRQKPMSYADKYNSTTRSYRQQVARGRVPGREGPKEIYNVSMVNATTKKSGDTQNKSFSQRPLMNTKVYKSLPQINSCSVTKKKMIAPNGPIRKRLDSRLLDAFRSNPYTQSLHSYVF